MADVRSRSIRIRNLPPGAQEGLLQQVLEKIVPVKRVEVFLDKQEAVVELPSAAVSQRLFSDPPFLKCGTGGRSTTSAFHAN